MAKEIQEKKRKASVPEGEAVKMKKVKKVEKVTTEIVTEPVKKRKATEDAASVKVKKTKTPKPALEEEPKSKPTKKIAAETNETGDSNSHKASRAAAKEVKSAKSVKTKDTAKVVEPTSDAKDNEEEAGDEQDDDSEIDDQTEALLKGFESDGDDDEVEGGLGNGAEVPDAPISKRSLKALRKVVDFPKNDKPGVVYVGRIPHGFYEHEMQEYFKQFGTITNIRMSRNRKTGQSKHIAWIEFESAAVAEIVAKTMDNYLLFSHILKVKVVPEEQVPKDLWKGANRRFKKVPWNKIEGRKLELAKPEQAWEKMNGREQARRAKKADQLKAIGYEFESPKLKSAKGMGKNLEQLQNLITEGKVKFNKTTEQAREERIEKRKDDEAAKLIEAGEAVVGDAAEPAIEEPTKPKKDKKRKAVEVEEEAVASVVAEEAAKPKKDKKQKTLETTVITFDPEGEVEKVKKTKKVKTVLAEDAGEVKAKKQKTNKKEKVTA